MNLTITFRHLEPTESIKAYATAKIEKLQKFLRQTMTARVTVSLDKLDHCVDVQIQSGGQSFEAKVTSSDLYASIDAVVDKLDRQINSQKGQTDARRRRDTDLRHADATPETPAVADA